MFRLNDKLVLNKTGLRNYKGFAISKKGFYAIVQKTQKEGDIVRVSWFNPKNEKLQGWVGLNFWAKYFHNTKSRKSYNHPLTPIFAKKMPHFGLAKSKKKRLDKKMFS